MQDIQGYEEAIGYYEKPQKGKQDEDMRHIPVLVLGALGKFIVSQNGWQYAQDVSEEIRNIKILPLCLPLRHGLFVHVRHEPVDTNPERERYPEDGQGDKNNVHPESREEFSKFDFSLRYMEMTNGT
jgi:hypothetical protein